MEDLTDYEIWRRKVVAEARLVEVWRLGRLRAGVSKGETGRCYGKTKICKEKIRRC